MNYLERFGHAAEAAASRTTEKGHLTTEKVHTSKVHHILQI